MFLAVRLRLPEKKNTQTTNSPQNKGSKRKRTPFMYQASHNSKASIPHRPADWCFLTPIVLEQRIHHPQTTSFIQRNWKAKIGDRFASGNLAENQPHWETNINLKRKTERQYGQIYKTSQKHPKNPWISPYRKVM